MSERSGGRERSEQSGASERVSGASELANGRASGPVLQSVFLAVLDHSALGFLSPSRCVPPYMLTVASARLPKNCTCVHEKKLLTHAPACKRVTRATM